MYRKGQNEKKLKVKHQTSKVIVWYKGIGPEKLAVTGIKPIDEMMVLGVDGIRRWSAKIIGILPSFV
jgi:hypothetical protein